MIFNTHSHLQDKDDQQVKNLIEDCLNNNVKYIAAIGYDMPSSKRALDLANKYNCVYAVCGIQPCEIDSFNDEFALLKQYIQSDKCIGIGEIGLDYYYGKENKEKQLYYFEEQLKIATQFNKPIIIHCRDAYEDTYNLLKKYQSKLNGIIMHCYSGSVEMMKEFVKLGCYISFSGVVTFKNAKVIKDVALNVPLDRLLVETDDPYLTPVPFRGQENKPSYVRFIVQEISSLRNIEFNELVNITTNNAKRVFHL